MNVDLISTSSPPVFRFLNAKLGSTSRFYQGLNDGVIVHISLFSWLLMMVTHVTETAV